MPLSADWYPVDPEELPISWPMFAPFIRRGLMRGEGSYNERDVLFACLAGQWQLWAYGTAGGEPEAICITEVVQFPRQRKLLVRYASGQQRHFLHSLDRLEDHAREKECHKVEIYGRRGWIKKLPDWSHDFVILSKEVAHVRK